MINEMVINGADNLEKHLDKIARDFYARLDRNFGLLSLSETVTSKLMWSFYSDGGRGFVLEFDTSHAWFSCKTADNDSFHHLRKVQYVRDREPMFFLDTKTDVGTKEDAVLYTKTCEWEFETEWRIIRNFKEAKEKDGADNYG